MDKESKLTPSQQGYKKLAGKHEIKRPVLKNCVKAFIIGGLVCTFGQMIQNGYVAYFDFTEKTAGDPTVATLVFIASLLTGLGIYDRFGQFAGAGSAVPVTGFANAMASAAIEHRTEGYVLGVGGNMFKLAGSVIVYGVFAAFVIVLVKYLFFGL
ncbi:stage V sporulation protein AC [Salipaludibacillus aurantiacus]|uniref:Stage V sporulation protein AC n=1 Tax=Salipaludibacillus aurantiacus TaxID=1601833 RepID=A0A1H9PD70_9BACI|nr:stage V sporulation protein AC [Salipaludibacillus aurantiacus]SER46107.1 stage V sporulation protein AC [Salipaludibacillus aurantiacus]